MLLLVACVALLGLASGCTTGYADDMTYGLRTDMLVITAPKVDPPFLDSPGQQALLVNIIAEQKGDILDPSKALNPGQRAKLEAALHQELWHSRQAAGGQRRGRSHQDAGSRSQEKILAKGSILFRRNCLHCHGLTGNGQGPTATWVNPHPRNYGEVSSSSSRPQGGTQRKPSRQDLLRVLRQGVEGTSMPPFGACPAVCSASSPMRN